MVPRAAHRAVDDQAFGERTTVMRAGRPDREDVRRSATHDDDGVVVDVAEQRSTILGGK
jgi:hypothetical protein